VGRLKLDDANYWYQERAFAIAGTAGTFGNTEVGGFGTIIGSFGNLTTEDIGTVYGTVDNEQSEITLGWTSPVFNTAIIVEGSTFRIDGQEIIKVISVEDWPDLPNGDFNVTYKVERGFSHTPIEMHVGTIPCEKTQAYNATLFDIGASYGSHFKWY
jgi:hypothetical protein